MAAADDTEQAAVAQKTAPVPVPGADDYDDDCPECRVCRGPEEEGRPLFSPCKCSGSIMHCHQECLLEWLKHSNKDRCELCSHRFDFVPVYAEDAPEFLPPLTFLRVGLRRATTEWIPLAARVVLALVLWLGVVPLVTSWLYRIWIHRSRVFVERLTVASVWGDVVSGLIIAAAIILSFLSLMSFADFLRFHWDVQNIRGDDPAPLVQHPPPPQRANVGGRLHLNRGERNQAAAVVEPLAPPMAALHAPPLIPAADPAVAPAATAAAAAAATSDGVQSQAAAVSTPEPLAPRPTPEPDDEVAMPAPAIPAPAFPAAGAREVKEEAALVVEGSGGKQTRANDDGGADSKDNHDEDDDGETEVYSGGGSDDEDDDGHSGALQIKLEQLGEDGECHEHDPLADDEAPLRDPDGDDLDGHGDPEHPNLDDDILDDLDNLNDEELAALDDDILDDLDDLGDDELVDVELQVAVDELLGVRGPVVVLLRNLLWLLAFNFAYLGLFAFVPFSIGSSVLVGVRRYATFLASEGPGSAAAAASAAAGTAAAAAGAGASVFDPRAALEAATAAAAGAATAVLELAPATDGAISTAAAAAAAMAAEGMPPQQEQEGAGGGGLGNGSVVDMLSEISRKAMEEGHTLQLPDLGTIALGYLVVSLMIFMWRAIVRAVCGGGGANARMRLLGKVRLALDCTAAVVKVGILLFLKMLLLPLLLGVCLDAATLSVFVEHTNDSTATGGYSISSDSSHENDSDSNGGGGFGSSAAITAHDRIAFTAQNLVGSLLLHWVLGITFMLFVTVSVLQLREVLHPDIFAAVIRPQEPHPDLLGSLLQESGATHARRMIMSLAIYMVLLFLFVWLPTNAFKAALPTSLPIHLRLFYWVPQLQVPAELVLFHLSVLAFLERFKNRIGELQHGWLVWACKRLGLTRYLLPLSSQVGVARNVPHTFRNGNDGGAEEKEEGAGDEAAAAAAAGNGDDGNGDDGNGNGEVIPEGGGGGGGGILEEDDGEHVGAPLQRPPPGWDDLLGGAQGRWAWGDEPRSPLELGLAPRRRPSHVLPRLLLLSVGCWVSVLALCLVGTSLPLVVGRALAALLHTPRRFNHDPLAFAAGLAFCLAAKGPFLACVAWLSTPRATVAQVKRRLAMATRLPADASTQPPRAAQAREQAAAAAGMGALVVFAVLWLGFLPILVGTLFEVTFVTGAEEWDSKGLAALAPLQDWGLGFVLLHGWAFLAAKGYFHQPDHQPDEHQGEAPIPNAQRQPVGLVGGGGGGAVAEPALAGAGEAPADAPPPPAAHNDQQQEQAGDGGGGAGWGAAGELAGVFPLFPMGQAPFAEGLEVVSWQRRLERAYRLVGAALAEGRWEEAGEDASSLGEALLWDLAIPVIVAWLKAVLVPMAAAFLGALAQRTARAHSLLAPPFSSEDGAPAGAVSAMAAAAAAAAATAAAPGALAVASPLTMFRHALGTCLFLTLLSALGGPLWACFRTLHDSIRDEQYLVGLELQDFHRPQPNKASEGPAASAAGGESSSSAASSSSSSSAEAAVAAAASTASEMASAAVVSGTGL